MQGWLAAIEAQEREARLNDLILARAAAVGGEAFESIYEGLNAP